jgi:hypothetical protein
VDLERGPLSLLSTIEELLGRKRSGSGLENLDYGRKESAALITRQSSIRRSRRQLRGQAAVPWSVFARGLRPPEFVSLLLFCYSWLMLSSNADINVKPLFHDMPSNMTVIQRCSS